MSRLLPLSFRAPAVWLVMLMAVVLPGEAQTQTQTPLSAEEFEAEVEGRTLTFATGGVEYGIEQFRPGRRVTWAFIGEECREGRWFPAPDDQICFVYEDDPQTHCWVFWLAEDGLRGRFTSTPGGSEIVAVERTSRPMFCPGPQVGA